MLLGGRHFREGVPIEASGVSRSRPRGHEALKNVEMEKKS